MNFFNKADTAAASSRFLENKGQGETIAIYVLMAFAIIIFILIILIIISFFRGKKTKNVSIKNHSKKKKQKKSKHRSSSHEIAPQKPLSITGRGQALIPASIDMTVGKKVNPEVQARRVEEESIKKEALYPKARRLGIENPEQYSFTRLNQIIMLKDIKGPGPIAEEKKETLKTTPVVEVTIQNVEKELHSKSDIENKNLKDIILTSGARDESKPLSKPRENDDINYKSIRDERYLELVKFFIEDEKLKQKNIDNTSNPIDKKMSVLMEKESQELSEKNKKLEEEIRALKNKSFEEEKQKTLKEFETAWNALKKDKLEMEKEKILLQKKFEEIEQKKYLSQLESNYGKLNSASSNTEQINDLLKLINKNNEKSEELINEDKLKTIEINLEKLSRKIENLALEKEIEAKKEMLKLKDDDTTKINVKSTLSNSLASEKNSVNKNSNKDKSLLETVEVELNLLNEILQETKKRK